THDVAADAVINAIRRGKWQIPVGRIRRVFRDALQKTGDYQAAKRVVDADKKRLAGVLFSGKFSRRTSDALIQHSGLICADLDGLGEKLPDVRAKLLNTPYLFALFLSPTRDGLKGVFRVPADGSK